jgi:hypothetical protein
VPTIDQLRELCEQAHPNRAREAMGAFGMTGMLVSALEMAEAQREILAALPALIDIAEAAEHLLAANTTFDIYAETNAKKALRAAVEQLNSEGRWPPFSATATTVTGCDTSD